MEHILQFAINIDDKTIEERVYEKASKQLTDDLKEQIYVSKNYYNHGFTDEATKVIKETVESYKPEIIEMAAKTLVDSIPIEFIRSEIINSTGFYNSSLRRLLDAWAERKEE